MNTIVLALDGFHSGFTGYGGASWIDAYALDELSTHGIVFDRFFSSCLNLSAIYDILWGTEETFAERLLNQGVKPALLADDASILEHSGSRGFKVIESCLYKESRPIAESLEQTALFETFAVLADLINHLSQSDQPFLCWAHIGSLARLWDAPDEYRSRYCAQGALPAWGAAAPPESISGLMNLEKTPDDLSASDLALQMAQTYAGQITVLNDCVSVLTDFLKQAGLTDKTSLALFSTRGIGLGEHDAIGLNSPAFNAEFARLSGLVCSPVKNFGPRRTQALVSYSEWSTLLELLAVNPESVSIPAGRSRLLGVQDDLRVVQTNAWRYLYDVKEPKNGQLYVMPDDRWEVNDTSKICENVIEELLQLTEDSELSDLLTNIYH